MPFYKKLKQKERVKIYELIKIGDRRIPDLKASILASEIKIETYPVHAYIHLGTRRVYIGTVTIKRPFLLRIEERKC